MVQNIPLVSLGWLFWLCPFLVSCPPSAHRTLEEGFGGKAVIAPLSNSQNTDVLLTLFQTEIQSPALGSLLWGKLTPSQLDTLQLLPFLFFIFLRISGTFCYHSIIHLQRTTQF